MSHFSLKCNLCFKCVREGEECRRLGAAQLTFWTRVGPWTILLCGECTEPIRQILDKSYGMVLTEHDGPIKEGLK